MNVLFLTLIDIDTIDEPGMYQDILREFVRHGHRVYVISPVERRKNRDTRMIRNADSTILKLKIGNTQKTGIIEKGISTLMIEPQFRSAIRKYFSDVRFDLVLYSTPPITLLGAIEYVKRRDGAKTYLVLKDIFPQNAVDLGMMQTTGPRAPLYRFFRRKEKKLYAASDAIGCMSRANVEYVLAHNPEVNPDIVEVCPNCAAAIDRSISREKRIAIREKYGMPPDKKVFVYGGNLGMPQGIDFMIDCLKGQADNAEAFFLIVGDGTEYPKIEAYMRDCSPRNIRLMKRLPKEDYDAMIAACDVGMIFLDHRFTIPNFPSRLVSYMQAQIPVLACTDPNTDIGRVAVEGGFGWWCESDDPAKFDRTIKKALSADLVEMGAAGKRYMLENYTAERIYEIIENRLR